MGGRFSKTEKQLPFPDSTLPKFVPGERSWQRRKLRTISSENSRSDIQSSTSIRKSQNANDNTLSFLDLPAELRNAIYTNALVFEGELLGASTRVPSIRLLQTCKQIHDEAASIFYSANSFKLFEQCEVDVYHDQSRTVYPQLDRTYQWQPLDRADYRHLPGGIVFPAPRYHRYLTRLRVELHIDLPVEHQQTFLPRCEITWGYAERARQDLEAIIEKAFEDVGLLWEQKTESWTGRMSGYDGAGDPMYVQFVGFSLKFEVNRTKTAHRQSSSAANIRYGQVARGIIYISG